MRQIVPFSVAGVLGGGLPARGSAPARFPSSATPSSSAPPSTPEDARGRPRLGHRHRPAGDRGPPGDRPRRAGLTVPGISVTQAGSPGQQTSLFTRGTNSNQTLLLWNGIQLNDPYFGGANWQFVPLDGVERVEVARGPFSALYGSNAVGGVVQVLTGSRQGGTVRLEGGEHGYKRAGLAAGGDLGRRPPRRHRQRAAGRRRARQRRLRQRGAGGPRPVDDAAGRLSLGVLVRANDSETGIPFSGAPLTPHRQISWQEREVAVPFRSSGDPGRSRRRSRGPTFDNAFRDPDDPFGFTRSDTKSEALARPHRGHLARRRGPADLRRHRGGAPGGDRLLGPSAPTSTARASGPGRRSARRAGAPGRSGSTSGCGGTTTTSTAARPACAAGTVVKLGDGDPAAGELRRGVPRAVAGRAVLPRQRQPRPPAGDAGATRSASSARPAAGASA